MLQRGRISGGRRGKTTKNGVTLCPDCLERSLFTLFVLAKLLIIFIFSLKRFGPYIETFALAVCASIHVLYLPATTAPPPQLCEHLAVSAFLCTMKYPILKDHLPYDFIGRGLNPFLYRLIALPCSISFKSLLISGFLVDVLYFSFSFL